MPIYSWDELPRQARPGNRAIQMVVSDRATILRVEHIGPAEHEAHVHEESEQISCLLEGEMEFTLGGETRRVVPGQVVVVPAGLVHATRVRPGMRAVALEYFSPPRRDLTPGR